MGNVIDPVDIMDGISLVSLNDKLKQGNLDPRELKTAEKYQRTSFPQGIPECGADALRMALVGYTTGGGKLPTSANKAERHANRTSILQVTSTSLSIPFMATVASAIRSTKV